MSLIGRRYAQALVDYAFETKAVEEFKKDFSNLINLYNKEEIFKNFLLNPQFKIEKKKEIIKNIYKSHKRKELCNLLFYLLDKGRIKNLPEIYEEYIVLLDRRKNILNMKVFSAMPIKDKQLKIIEEKYKKLYNASGVNVETYLDKSLIAGIKIVVGNKEIDNSIKGSLKELQRSIN